MANSTYDNDLHLAIITNDYFKTVTGLDLVVEEGNKERAEAKMITFHNKAKALLFLDKAPRVQDAFNYLIKLNDTWRAAWENYVVIYIESFYYGKDFIWGNEEVPNGVINAVYGSVLRSRELTDNIYNEIENSSEEW